MKEQKLTIVTNYEDWEGLYIDGKLVDEDHHLQLKDVLKLLGYDVVVKECNFDWICDRGLLPDNLDDVNFSLDESTDEQDIPF